MQRVAIGRALVRRPKAMLMDEPIGALDAKLREDMRAEIKRLHIENGSTTIYVTHDQVEAMCARRPHRRSCTRACCSRSARPTRSISHPANLFVAQFVGCPVMNIAAGERRRTDGDATRVVLGGGASGFDFPAELAGTLARRCAASGELALGIRPEGVLVARTRPAGLHAGRGAHHRAARRL